MSEAEVANLLVEDLLTYSGAVLLVLTFCAILSGVYILTTLGSLRARLSEIMLLLQSKGTGVHVASRRTVTPQGQNPRRKTGKKAPVL